MECSLQTWKIYLPAGRSYSPIFMRAFLEDTFGEDEDRAKDPGDGMVAQCAHRSLELLYVCGCHTCQQYKGSRPAGLLLTPEVSAPGETKGEA